MAAEHTTAESIEAPAAPLLPAQALPAGLPGHLLALQRTAGNAAVRALIQRKIEPGDLPGKKPSEAMADDTYIDNNMVKLEFYDAQAAVVHYKDGSKLSLGLVPEHIKPPFEGVDYRSTTHMRVMGDTPGKLSFVPHATEIVMKMPDTAPAGDLLKFARDVTFKHDAASGRVVPTEVNSITAPRLCQLLRETEAEYVRDFDAFAKGGEKVMKKLEIVVILASLLSGPKPARRRRRRGRGVDRRGARRVDAALLHQEPAQGRRRQGRAARGRGRRDRRRRGRRPGLAACSCATATSSTRAAWPGRGGWCRPRSRKRRSRPARRPGPRRSRSA